MSFTVNYSTLILDHNTRHLKYSQESRELGAISRVVGALLLYPIYLIVSPVLVPAAIIEFYLKKKKQAKILNTLKDPALLQEYKKIKLNKLADKIRLYEKTALRLVKISSLVLPEELKGYSQKWGPETKESYWKTFLKTDFYLKATMAAITPTKHDSSTLHKLEWMRQKLLALEEQANILNAESEDGAFQEILRFKAIKNRFKMINTKHAIIQTFICILPLGLAFTRPMKENFAYAGKDKLPQLAEFAKYNDLVEAHNDLIKGRAHLVPLLKEFK